MRVFENRVLRKIYGSKRGEVTGEWRKLHNEELNDLYSSPNVVRVIKSRRIRWLGHVARMGERRGLYRVLVGKPEGKIQFERPRHRWEDNINMDIQEVGCGGMDWIEQAQDRDRNVAVRNTLTDIISANRVQVTEYILTQWLIFHNNTLLVTISSTSNKGLGALHGRERSLGLLQI